MAPERARALISKCPGTSPHPSRTTHHSPLVWQPISASLRMKQATVSLIFYSGLWKRHREQSEKEPGLMDSSGVHCVIYWWAWKQLPSAVVLAWLQHCDRLCLGDIKILYQFLYFLSFLFFSLGFRVALLVPATGSISSVILTSAHWQILKL